MQRLLSVVEASLVTVASGHLLICLGGVFFVCFVF